MRSLVLTTLLGCGSGTVNWSDARDTAGSASDADADADGDADGDTDADGDADTDTDADETGTAPDDTAWEWPSGLDSRVCADGTEAFTDIQAAIDASSPGDHIGVCPGTYGPISVTWSFDVEITGVAGPDQTTIDGAGGPAVTVRDGDLVLSGFRVTGTGVEDPFYPEGAAFSMHETDSILRDCVVADTTGPFSVLFDEDTLVMEDVVWEDNETTILWFLYEGDSVRVTGNLVRGGVHESVLMAPDLTDLRVENNVFTGISIDRAKTAFGFDSNGEGSFVVANNVFHEVDDLEPYGGRVFSGAPTFENNIVLGCDAWDLRPMAASYSLFWDNGVDYAPTLTGTANLFEDPRFVDAAGGDFALLPDSPAIDAGDPGGVWLDADGTRNDMGCYGGH